MGRSTMHLYMDQAAWLRAEMQHEHQKTGDYPEKLRRLRLQPDQADSSLRLFGSYWWRFEIFADAVRKDGSKRGAAYALQMLGKVVAGLTDTVGLGLWLSAGMPEEDFSSRAVAALRQQCTVIPVLPDWEKIFAMQDLSQTPIGGKLAETQAFAHGEPVEAGQLMATALAGAVLAVQAWTGYSNHLAGSRFSEELPRPGLPHGNLQPWPEAPPA